MVFARVSADADHPSLSNTMVAIAENRAMYSLSGAARVLSALTLMAAAWYLLKTWIIRERLGTPLVPYLFLASGVFTAVSGALALVLAATAPEITDPNIRILLSQTTETTADLRGITGKIGFTLMGLALIARGAAPVEGRRDPALHRRCFGRDRHRDAVHLDRRGHHCAQGQRGRRILLAPGRRLPAPDGAS